MASKESSNFPPDAAIGLLQALADLGVVVKFYRDGTRYVWKGRGSAPDIVASGPTPNEAFAGFIVEAARVYPLVSNHQTHRKSCRAS